MTEIEKAVDLLLEHIKTQTETMELDILKANSFILAEDIYSPVSVPGFPKSAMDGYAVKSEDTITAGINSPVLLKTAGKDDYRSHTAGTAVKIMTGEFIPDFYDCVIKQEDTDNEENHIKIFKNIKPWENYCKIGEDIQKGELVLKKNTGLKSFHTGILASLGITSVKVLKPLSVGIIATGNEIVKPGDPLVQHKIYDSCSYVIASSLIENGVNVLFMEICEDDEDKISALIKDKINLADILITVGSISVGTRDILPKALKQIGAEQIFKHINMKPGTPVLANHYSDKVILSLSGNPFAAFVNFHIFFWPLLKKFMKNKELGLRTSEAVLKSGYIKKDSLRRFIRAYEENGSVTAINSRNHASVLSSLAECNCLIDQKPNTEIKKGDKVKIIYFK